MIYALIGVGIGALLRNQVGAIVGGLVYLFVVEPVIRSIRRRRAPTSGCRAAAWRPSRRPSRARTSLPPWQGGLLLLGYGLLAASWARSWPSGATSSEGVARPPPRGTPPPIENEDSA